MNAGKELSPDSAQYHCSACHGDEAWSDVPPTRGRAKARSLSASPAAGSTREFRYGPWFVAEPSAGVHTEGGQ